jgi:hypothetical protein
MSIKYKSILLILTAVIMTAGLKAQTNTYSPYSRYGIGDVAKQGFGRNQGLGGIGLGLRDNNHINYINPAAYSAQDTMSFLFSTGITGNTMQLSSNEGSHNTYNVTLSHLAIAFPVSRWWNTSFGLVPYSQMGYKIIDVNLSQGSEEYYEGSGGINQFFFGNAINLTRNFSAGVNISYMFGSLTQQNRLLFPLRDGHDPVYTTSRTSIGDFHFRYGMQYTARFLNDYRFTLGVIYENKTPLNTTRDLLIINEGLVRDTAFHYSGSENYIDLPETYGVGFSFRRDNKFVVGADYSISNWSETSFLGRQDHNMVNSSSLNVGVQYIPDHTDFRNFLNRIQYRAGFHHSNTYLQLRDHQLNDTGITIGFGLPYRNTGTTFNFSLDMGRRGTTDMNLIREHYAVFNFSLSLHDFWFLQRRFE